MNGGGKANGIRDHFSILRKIIKLKKTENTLDPIYLDNYC